VNQERYLDSVVGIALERGMRVIGFECQGYLNWGSPDALRNFPTGTAISGEPHHDLDTKTQKPASLFFVPALLGRVAAS